MRLSAAIEVEGVRVSLINDFNGRQIPLMAANLTPLAVSGSGTVSHFVVESDVNLEVNLYNAERCKWEPLVEACSFRLGGQLQLGDTLVTDLRFDAPRPCNFNVSPAMCSLLSNTVLTLAADVGGADELRLNEHAGGTSFSPYSITNSTGVPLRYGRAHSHSPPGAVLVPGATETFNFWPEASDRQTLCGAQGPPACALALVCDGWALLEEVPVELVGQRVVEVFPVDKGGDASSPAPRRAYPPSR